MAPGQTLPPTPRPPGRMAVSESEVTFPHADNGSHPHRERVGASRRLCVGETGSKTVASAMPLTRTIPNSDGTQKMPNLEQESKRNHLLKRSFSSLIFSSDGERV